MKLPLDFSSPKTSILGVMSLASTILGLVAEKGIEIEGALGAGVVVALVLQGIAAHFTRDKDVSSEDSGLK